MLILHDGNPLNRIASAWENHALMLAIILVFLLEMTEAFPWQYFAFFPQQLWTASPEPGPLNGVLGLFTHQFLHADLLHIIGNLVTLRVFGDNIEDALGHLRYALFFLLSGAVAALAQGIVEPTVPLIGASGAISAVMAGYLLLHPRAHLRVGLQHRPGAGAGVVRGRLHHPHQHRHGL